RPAEAEPSLYSSAGALVARPVTHLVAVNAAQGLRTVLVCLGCYDPGPGTGPHASPQEFFLFSGPDPHRRSSWAYRIPSPRNPAIVGDRVSYLDSALHWSLSSHA